MMEYMESKMQDYIENGISEADRCYARIAELEEQVNTLQQFCLTAEEVKEIKAQAGRDGFIAGYFHYKNYGFQFEEELEAASNQYHASILAGKE